MMHASGVTSQAPENPPDDYSERGLKASAPKGPNVPQR